MKERRVEFAPEAESDLLGIYRWIESGGGPDAALGYVERLERHCLGLAIGSERGHRRDDLRPGLRVTAFRRTVMAFTVEETRVVILRLFHGGRNWEDPSHWTMH